MAGRAGGVINNPRRERRSSICHVGRSEYSGGALAAYRSVDARTDGAAYKSDEPASDGAGAGAGADGSARLAGTDARAD
jgi:hypothetical protein